MSWYLLSTRPRLEFAVETNLNIRGITTFLPKTYSDRKSGSVAREIPFFNRYLFFRMEPGTDNFYMVSKTPGVSTIVKMTESQFGGFEPTKIPDLIIIGLQNQQNDRGVIDMDEDYKQGDKVRVKNGAFHGVEAIISAKTGQDRVMVLLNILGGEQKVEFHYHQIEPAA